MRIVVNNGSTKPVRTPWPWRGEVPPGTEQEFHLEDRGFPVLSAISLAVMAEQLEGVTVRIFKGTPEEEYEVVRTSSMPTMVKKSS